MVAITLPDGSPRHYDHPVTGAEIARDIGPGLAKSALAVRIDGEMKDLAPAIDRDAQMAIVTPDARRAGTDPPRHRPCAGRGGQGTVSRNPGHHRPAIENGFYYDFARDEPFTPDDLATIEARMREIVARDEPIVREEWDRDEAIAFFKRMGENYKAEIIASIPADQPISVYRQGELHGPVPRPASALDRQIGKAFKLTKLAGAYWRGDPATRCCSASTAPPGATRRTSTAYLTMLEEAEKRDHRKLGREMDLFHHPGRGRRAASSGIPRAGRSTARSRTISAAGWTRPAMSRSRRRSCSTARCGRLGPLGQVPREHVRLRDARTKRRHPGASSR